MNRALFAGLSGTIAFQERLDVVGNNIANSNTIAYKQGRITFEDALYQTLQGGRAGSDVGMGGTNPMQIGSGVSVRAVSIEHTQGALERTGQPLDAAIEGPGMFVLSDGQSTFYTRAGAFMLDDTNTLVSTGTGHKVMGWLASDGVVNPSGTPSQLNFDLSALTPPEATSGVTLEGNLDATSAVGDSVSTSISVYDSLGQLHLVDLQLENTDIGEWSCTATCEGSSTSGTVTFASDGSLNAGATLMLDIALANGAASPLSVQIDLSNVTSVAGAHTVTVASRDGRPAAALVSVELSDGGLIEGHFSDGRTRILGQLALATFSNPGGLRRIGGNLYTAAVAAGQPRIGAAGSGGRGNIVAGSLEMSNVDLTRAFVDMITTQRGFQASTRVIATANEMLDDVVRLIRI